MRGDVVVVVEVGTPCPPEVASFAATLTAPAGEPSRPVPRLTVLALSADGPADACSGPLADEIGASQPVAVVAAGTDRLTEVMAHVAARLDLPLAVNCVGVTRSEPWLVTRARGGGVLLEDAEVDAAVLLATVSPAAPAVRVSVQPPPARELTAGHTPIRLVERADAGGGVTLASAPVVVSGGRGIGSTEGFGVLEELADLLGGAVGCSRVVTNNGWRPHSDQVGQTGTKVAPKVYIAAGISGATQHWAGCMGSETIIAINTDRDAAMVARADYAVIGDANEVLTAVAAETRRRIGSTGGDRPAGKVADG